MYSIVNRFYFYKINIIFDNEFFSNEQIYVNLYEQIYINWYEQYEKMWLRFDIVLVSINFLRTFLL